MTMFLDNSDSVAGDKGASPNEDRSSESGLRRPSSPG